MNRTLAIGDIHGSNKALLQCLERSKFDYKNDNLIALGDVVDGWTETPQAIETLLKVKNLIYIIGNHDAWADEWIRFGNRQLNWVMQGGQATIDAYLQNGDLLVKHRNFFLKGGYKYIDSQNRLFVHGGILKGVDINDHTRGDLMWDRSLVERSMQKLFKGDNRFTEIYVGHTSIWSISHEPIIKGNVIMLDTGGGWEGKLSIMDINTKEFWQSDKVSELHPESRGRG